MPTARRMRVQPLRSRLGDEADLTLMYPDGAALSGVYRKVVDTMELNKRRSLRFVRLASSFRPVFLW